MSIVSVMQRLSIRVLIALISAISVGSMAGGSVNAADMPVPPSQYGDTQEYYDAPPRERYVYPRPPAYYIPPPITYYEYAPPAVVVEPEVYYLHRRYAYRDYPYHGYGPYVTRGYGRHGERWSRGYHR